MKFPDLSADEVHAATAERWDLGTAVPTPRWTLTCPICGSDQVQPRHWRYFERTGATIPYRCDVSVKCCVCAYVWTHGIALTADAWIGRRKVIQWRKARTMLEES